ncbi:MAG: EAL domain-containing protein [Thiotrichales bacterium]|nr:EAL domain-containing protein [Thiotrichales bacterium]
MIQNNRFSAKLNENTGVSGVDHQNSRVLDNIRDVILELDAQGKLIFINPAWSALTGHNNKQSLGTLLSSYIHTDDSANFSAMVARTTNADNDHTSNEVRLICQNKDTIWVTLSLDSKMIGSDKAIFGCIVGASKHHIYHPSPISHDAVTGAFNRHHFELELQSHINSLPTQSNRHGLLYLELRNFKLINQALSHADGDNVLKEIAELLSSCLQGNDQLCRIGGYEFALFLHSRNQTEIDAAANNILKQLASYRYSREPFSFIIGGNIGIRLIDNSDIKASEYISDAVKATAISKKIGRNHSHLYTQEDSDSDPSHGCDWSHHIHRAIEEDRLELYLQPIRSINDNKINHYEALLRLIDADSGKIIQPEQFIDAIERSGAIVDVDRWVITNAIKLLSQQPQIHQLAINLSAHAFENAELHMLIHSQLKHFQVAPQRVILELTETSSLINLEQTHTVISNLRKIGCQFALDDFGTGFCSFSYLKHLPADYVKLDGSYIKNICNNKLNQVMVRSMNDMVHAIGHKTIAECVESPQAIELLSDIGVDYIQGFSVGKPSPLAIQ